MTRGTTVRVLAFYMLVYVQAFQAASSLSGALAIAGQAAALAWIGHRVWCLMRA